MPKPANSRKRTASTGKQVKLAGEVARVSRRLRDRATAVGLSRIAVSLLILEFDALTVVQRGQTKGR